MTRLENQLIEHEGFRSRIYNDPSGTNFCVGYGRNIQDKGLTKAEALYLLRNDIHECIMDLIIIFPNWSDLNEDRKMVLVGMRFGLGIDGFREFKNMIRAVKDGNFTLAAHEMMDSLWYKQVGDRGVELRDMMGCE